MRNAKVASKRQAFFRAIVTVTMAGAALSGQARAADEWVAYGHDPGGMRFSPLAQVNRANVTQLRQAWTFHTGDIVDGKGGGPRSGFETTPLFVDGELVLTTPLNRVIALDPVSGRQLWAFDPKIDRRLWYGDGFINRGAATWLDPGRARGQACRRRIFEATLDARLVALDALTGAPCVDFGQQGEVSLRGVRGYLPGAYHMTSPPAVIDGLVVVGSGIDDNSKADMPSGVVRAFDARTGALRWSWEPLEPHAGMASGAGNAWSVMAVDAKRHLVFVPTGSASPDYYGGLRPGDNRWANSVVALDARTGKLTWGFQLVHHDLWDYDSAAPTLLATIPHAGRPTDVVVQGNKTGFLYVLDRASGRPVFPVEERPVPQSDVPGEATSPTQPFPTVLPAVTPQSLRPEDVWGATPADRDACRAMLRGKSGQIFTPPSVGGGLAIPGNVGGINWSGYAFDPQRNLLIVSTTNLPYLVRLIPREGMREATSHPDDNAEYARQSGTPYGLERRPLLGPSFAPCIAPPWGALVAVDLAKGVIRWRAPLGSIRDLSPGAPDLPTGSPGLGGPIVTAGGLVFVAGTVDRRLHGFDLDTGKEVWTAELPASAHATPMTYQTGGKQYLVIASGGSAKITQEGQSDSVIAFALP